jgi:hypothetical protein
MHEVYSTGACYEVYNMVTGSGGGGIINGVWGDCCCCCKITGYLYLKSRYCCVLLV